MWVLRAALREGIMEVRILDSFFLTEKMNAQPVQNPDLTGRGED